MLAPNSPLILAAPIVSNSGTDVATPAISPTVFGFKFRFSAKLLSVLTNIYFEIKTINPE